MSNGRKYEGSLRDYLRAGYSTRPPEEPAPLAELPPAWGLEGRTWDVPLPLEMPTGEKVDARIKPDNTVWIGKEEIGTYDIETGELIPKPMTEWERAGKWAVTGLEYLFKPFEYVQEYAFTPLAELVTMPFWAGEAPEITPGQLTWEDIKALFPGGEYKEAYHAWEAPKFLKGALEVAPWFALPGIGQIAGALAKGGKAAQLAAKGLAYSPYGLMERGVAKAIEAPLKALRGKVAQRLMPDLEDFGSAIEIANRPDTFRKLANTKVFRPIARLIGGKAATMQTAPEKAVVGRHILREEGRTKALGVMAHLDQFGTSRKMFNLAEDGTIASGSLKGTHLNTIRTYPQRYADKLTPEQNAWVKHADDIEKAKLEFLKRNDIDINELAFEEGGQYAGRRVYGRVTDEGELLEAAYIGAGPGRPGAKAAFEKTRRFKTAEEAMENGFKYLPEEDALRLNVQAAYNRVADKKMADWLLERIPYRTTGAPEKLKMAAEQAKESLGIAKLLRATLNRAARGEKVPQATLDKIASKYPQEAEGLIKAIKTLGERPTGKARAAIKIRTLQNRTRQLEEGALNDWHKAENARARARERAMTRAFDESTVPAPAFAGKILTGPEAKATAKLLREEFDPAFNKALGAINKVNAVGRYFALAGDVSPASIQLIFLAGAHPKVYLSALKGFVRAFFDPEFHAKYLAKHIDTVNSSPGLLLTRGGATEFTEAMARGGLLRKGPLKVGGKVLEPFQRGFETSLDVAGIEMKEALGHLATTAARNADVDAFINEFRGLVSTSRLGVSTIQRQLETATVLAPRYNRAIAALLGDVARGNLRGELARKSLAKGITAIAAMTVAVSYAMGEDEDEIVEHFNISSPKFMTWEIAGQNIGPGSKVRSLIYTFAKAKDNPENLFEFGMENPNLRFVRGNLSPVVSTGLDLLLGENYVGDPTREGLITLKPETGEVAGFLPSTLGNLLLPIWVQSMLFEGGNISGRTVRAMGEFGGLRTYPQRDWDKLKQMQKELAQKEFDQKFEELNYEQKDQLKAKYPEYKELAEQAAEGRIFDYGEDWQQWLWGAREQADAEYHGQGEMLAEALFAGLIDYRTYLDEESALRKIYQGEKMTVNLIKRQADPEAYERLEKYREENPLSPEDQALDKYWEIRRDLKRDPETQLLDWDSIEEKTNQFLDSLDTETRDYVLRMKDRGINKLPPKMQAIAQVQSAGRDKVEDYYDLPEGKARTQYRRANPTVDAWLLVMGRVTRPQTSQAMRIALQLLREYKLPESLLVGAQRIDYSIPLWHQ